MSLGVVRTDWAVEKVVTDDDAHYVGVRVWMSARPEVSRLLM